MGRVPNILEDTFDRIRLFEGEVAQDSTKALRGIHSNGVEMGEPCIGRWTSWCEVKRRICLPHVI